MLYKSLQKFNEIVRTFHILYIRKIELKGDSLIAKRYLGNWN